MMLTTMHRLPTNHRVFIVLIGIALAYMLGLLAMLLAYSQPSDYTPPLSEVFIVPLLLALHHPLVAILTLALCMTLTRLCWHPIQ